jgi:Ca2+-binding RTX toxin-like protein
MAGIWKRLFGGSPQAKEAAARARRRSFLRRPLRLESLERREVFAVDAHFTSSLHDIIEINGTDGSDDVTVEIAKNNSANPFDDQLVVKDHGNTVGKFNVWHSVDDPKYHNQPSLWTITFYGGKGNDHFEVIGSLKIPFTSSHAQPLTQEIYVLAFGEDGNDTLIGGDADGLSYDNQPYGYDLLEGGDGNDTIYGGKGIDFIKGGAGRDTLSGEGGDDQIDGGNDRDEIYGGEGNDKLTAGLGNDTVDGGLGNDVVYGDMGLADTLNYPHLAALGGNDNCSAAKATTR